MIIFKSAWNQLKLRIIVFFFCYLKKSLIDLQSSRSYMLRRHVSTEAQNGQTVHLL